MSGANSTNGSGKKELAFIVGGFFPGREGRERMVAPYAIDKELIGDPVFSEFARAACPFMMPGIYPQDPDLAVSTGYRMKETGHQAFKEGDYKLAATKYNYSVQLFQFVLKIFPYVAHEVLLLHNSLSACYYKMKDYEKALASANTCIELDNKEIKGFYRRAEASLGLADVGSSEGKDVTKLYEEALGDFCKCYYTMTMESDKGARVQQFCDAMIIAINLNLTENLPDFHEFDKDSFCGPLIIHLLNNYTKEKIEKALQFLFFPSPSVEKSGLAFKYPCDVSSLSVCLVYTRGVLTEPILDMLVQCNIQIKQTDVVQLVSALQESELSLFQRLVSICEAQSTTSCESAFSHLLDRSLLSRNQTFATYLISKGVTPTRLSSALAFEMLMEFNSSRNEDIIKISNACSPDVRAEFAAKSLAMSNLPLFHEILDTGPLHSCYIDISTFICSPLMNEEMKYLNRFLDTGACPNGVVGSTSPMVAIFQGNTLNRETPVPLSRETQVLLVVILIERGASVINLTGAFPDPMSPVHVATKLVLETKIIKLLHLVCERFDFPSNGRIVDKHNRTPLHIVMITEPTLLSLEILEVLVKYNIDKSIKDDQGKRAEDYTRPQLDEKRRALVSLRPPAKVKDLKHEGGGGGGAVTGDKGGLPWRYKEYNFDDEDISSDEETGSGRRGGRKKWEMRYLKMAKSGRPPWSCDMSLFPPSTSFEKALAIAREQKERGNTLFGDKKYSEALQMYGKSHMTYDWICVNHPRKLSAVKDDIKVLVCNMALGYHRSSVPEASVECCNDAIDIDPTYYKAYYRRAEAYKYIAKERTHQTRRDYNFECYCLAVKDYARAYKYFTATNETSKRADMFYECMVIALDVDHTKFLPSIHDCDKSQLLTKVVELLVKNREKQSKELSLYLDYLLLKTSHIPNAGLAQSYPCSCSSVPLVHVLPSVQVDLYKALLLKGCTVTEDDIVALIRVLKKSQGQLLKLLLDSFMKDRDDIQSSLTSICVQILSMKKIPFISTLVKNGATPPSENILEHSDFFKLDSVLSKYVSNACKPESRTKLFCAVLQSGGTKESIDVLLQSGPVLIQDIDLSAIITSSLLLHHTEILKELHSITPPSDLPVTSSASKALSLLLGSKLPSQLQQAQLADSLIKLGANISGLPQAYSEPLSPVHAATKLALETGHVDLVYTVCTRYTFDGQVKLIDRNTQTPLHYVMRYKHNEKSIKICQYLCDYPIDPQIKDRWGKAAQEYGKKEGDKRLTYLHRAAVLTGRHTPTPEAPETGGTESAPNTNDNVGTVNEAISSSNPPPLPPPQTESGKSRKNKKKKKNKGGNAASSSDKTTHDGKSAPLVNGTVDNGTTDKGRDSPVTPEENVHVHVPLSTTEGSDAQPSCPSLKTLLSILNKKGSEYFTLQIDLSDPLEDAAIDQHESSFSGTDAVIVESDYITQEDKLSLSNGVATDEVFKIDFDSLPWEVEVTDRVLLFLKDPAYSKVLKISVISRLQELARGRLSDGKTLSCSAQLYKTSLTSLSCIMWEKAVQFSSRCTDKTKREDSGHVYSEVIRVWDVIPNKEHLTCLQQIERSHQRGLQSHLCFPLLPSEEEEDEGRSSHLPRHFLIFKDHNPAHDDSVAMVTYVPPARVKEDEYNVVTFYSLTSSVVQSVINGYRPRRDFPFKEWPKEHNIIHLPSNAEAILLLGRSGTGKTTCCLYRLWNQFNQYWEQVFANEGDPCYPHRPLPLMNQSSIELRDIVGAEDEGMGGDGVGVAYINEEEEEEEGGVGEAVKYEHLHQVFLTKNYVLCSQMKKRFYDMVASYDTYSQHLEYEALPCPLSLKDINSKAFPLFLTSRQFLLLLDNSLGGKTFFPRSKDGSLAVKICSSDYETEDLGTLLDLDVSDGEEEETNEEDELARVVGIKQVPVWREVTSCYFVNEIWPKISSHCSDKSIDPLLVWIEIKSFIKGSLLAVSKPSGCLSPWEYESIGRKMATNFSGNRTEIYSLFEHYRDYIHRKRSLNLFDENDLINNIYQRLVKSESPELPWSIHHFFIDEVQDFTQSELALILRLSQEPNGLFLTGDTAQSIMKGISFRFRDLRSLFHLAKTQSGASPSPMRISVPRVHELLINFRSHSGILRLATSVIELLKEYFPSSFDRLPEDRGMFPGPLPVFIQSCHVTDLAVLLRSNKRASSCIEFGAHQVIIVQNEEAKKSLPDVLKGAVVLTVFESKGLEFDDVLLYNFFTDSSITKEWRVVSTYADKTAPPSDSKTKPRPLNFNERFHKSLNSEFKYLYTAITRAKCNLWIYDSSETQRLPMFDYWMRRELIKVVRVGEKDDDDSFLFTATSTNEQWSRQGDYFLKKGLWEPAMKCYSKAGDLFSEKEAEGFYFAQRARSGRSQKEAGDFFEKAAWSFLLCDNIRHSLKHVENAAKCLKNAKKYSDAAKLFENLGQVEHAKRCYFRAKDLLNLSRMREIEGDHSGAVRVFVQANKRLEALEKAKSFETQGFEIEPDVASLQLANTYAKYYLNRQDEILLMRVLQYIPNIVQRVAHLKKGNLFDRAVDEYIKAGHFKDAERLIVAQEMYDRGVELAITREDKTMEAKFILMKTVANIYQKEPVDDELSIKIQGLTKSSIPPIQAKALLLLGMVHSRAHCCREAVKVYTESCVNNVGALEAFNQLVLMKKSEVPYTSVVVKCYEAQELIWILQSSKATPTRSKALQQLIEFYKFSKLEKAYLLPQSQDIWVQSLGKVAKEIDENGMLVFDQAKVHSCIIDHFTEYISNWIVDTDAEKQILSRLASYTFHNRISEQGYLTSFLHGYPPNLIKEYIQTVDAAIKIQSFNPNKYFRGFSPELLPLKLFSFRVSVCLPLSKINCFQIRRSEAAHNALIKTMDSLINPKVLRQPHVDDLFKAWFCQCLIDSDSPNHFEETIENFAKKEGTANYSKPWLVVDRHGKAIVFHHFFAFWLKACRLIREGQQVLVASKLVYNCFFTVIARRQHLRKTTSVLNYVFPVTVFSSALVGILSVAKPNLGLCLPLYYRYQCQLFDVLNIQGGQQFWLLSACVKLAEEKKNDVRVIDDSIDLLHKMLELLLGIYQPQFDLLKFSLSPESNACEDGSLVHCLGCALVLIAVLEIVSPEKQEELFRLLIHVQETLRESVENPEIRTPPYVQAVVDRIDRVNTVGDLFSLVQFILHSAHFTYHIGKMQAAKTGNMDFKEIQTIPQQAASIIVRPKVLTPPRPPQPPPRLETKVKVSPPSQNSDVMAPIQQGPAVSSSGEKVSLLGDTQLQEQWMFINQRLDELQQYGGLIQQQLTTLRQTPPHLIIDPAVHEQQQYFLTQQYYQLVGAQQQYKLQQESIQQQYQQYQLSVLNNASQAMTGGGGQPVSSNATMTSGPQNQTGFNPPNVTTASQGQPAIPPFGSTVPMTTPYSGSSPQIGRAHQEQEYETDAIFDEEEIENILGSLMSGGPVQRDKVPPLQGFHTIDDDFRLSVGADPELVDTKYCQVCGVSFLKQPFTDEFDIDEETGSQASSKLYRDHIGTQSHIENLQAYKRFTAVKSGPYSLLRSKLEEALVRGRKLITAAEVDALVLQVTSDLRELDEQLEESTNSYNWKEAHGRLVSSLDLLQSLALRLTRTCETVAYVNERLPRRDGRGQGLSMGGAREGEHKGGGGYVDLDDFDIADDFELAHEKFVKTKQRKARI